MTLLKFQYTFVFLMYDAKPIPSIYIKKDLNSNKYLKMCSGS